jgi:hypothetical protein
MKPVVLLVCAAPLAVGAEPRSVAIAPVAPLTEGVRGLGAVEATLAAAAAAVPEQSVIAADRVREAARRARRRDLEACEGAAACLAELGRVAGAQAVVYAEVGALAQGQVVYVKAVDVAGASELSSTTLWLGDKDGAAAARAAMTRLLAPSAYVGTLALTADVAGASVFVDGRAVGRTPLAPLALPVGMRALRVTHPTTRDFVRFVEIQFAERAEVRAELAAYPVTAGGEALVIEGKKAWFESPWALAGIGAGVLVTALVIAALIPRGVERDRDVVVEQP